MNDLMTLADIAEMNHCSLRHARDVLVRLPGFPDERQAPGGRRVWSAQEVHNFVNRKPLDAPGNFHLYRHFDETGALLYVGVSLNTVSRLVDHKRTAKWFSRLARVEVQRFPTREASLDAERLAVETERPLYNIQLAKQQ